MKVLIDNGHGKETAGKRSPDGKLREYAWAREMADMVVNGLRAKGIDAERIVPEESDVSLSARVKRANAICKRMKYTGVLLVSIHVNAAASDSKWHDARGWQVCVSLNASQKSKTLANALYGAASRVGLKMRPYAATVNYWKQNLAICRDTLCPAVLTENLFQDNKQDVDYLLSDEGKKAIAKLHVDGICKYISMQ